MPTAVHTPLCTDHLDVMIRMPEDYVGIGPKMESFTSTTGDTLCDVTKVGYLKKMKTNKKKYFVLRQRSQLGPARLEYYDSEKRFTKPGAVPKRIMKIVDCWNICQKQDSKHKHVLMIFTREDSLLLMAENDTEHNNWLNELSDLHEKEFTMLDEKPPKFEHMWNVTMKAMGLGVAKNYVGRYRLCLSPSHMSFIRLDMEIADLSVPLSSIRRCGHNESHFVIGVGRSAPTGEGDLIMLVDDASTAQNMHGVILDAMKSNKLTESVGNTRARSRSNQTGKGSCTLTSSASHRSTSSSHDLYPVSRPRTMSESTKVNSYSGQRASEAMDRRSLSYIGRSSGIGSSTPSSPFSSSSSIEHNFRHRCDSSASRGTTTSEENASYRDEPSTSSERPLSDEADYIDMTCGTRLADQSSLPGDDNFGAVETSSHHSNHSSRHSCQSLENITEDSGYMDTASGGSTSSSKQDGASRRPSLVSPPDDYDEYCLHSPLDVDFLLNASPDSTEHTTPVDESQPSSHYGVPTPTRPETARYDDESDYCMQAPSAAVGQDEADHGARRSSAVPIPPLFNEDYLQMGPCHSLPTVKERSGESRTESEQNLGFGIIFPPHHDVKIQIAQQMDNGADVSAVEFPKRAYSVGSRSDIKKPESRLQRLSAKENKNDAKSSSAPHLLDSRKHRLTPPSSALASPIGSSSPSNTSRQSLAEDQELFMELSFDRQRTFSNSSDSPRPRTSSWGQACRPRAQSQASKLKRAETQVSHGRSSSQELFRSVNARRGRTGSSESLRKIHFVSAAQPGHDYAEIAPTGAGEELSEISLDAAREFQQLAESVNEMTLQYREITGPVGIVSRGRSQRTTSTYGRGARATPTSRPPRPIAKGVVIDTYIVSEPVSVRRRGSADDGTIPRMVDVWSPQIQSGDEDEDEYACLNQSS